MSSTAGADPPRAPARQAGGTAPAERFDMHVTGFVSAILVGSLVGVLGRLLIPGKQPIGVPLTLLVGIGAAFLGSFIANRVGIEYVYGIDWFELLLQVVVAGIAVLALTMVFRRQIQPSTRPRAARSRSRRRG
jgi:uncharacterized membrane protein YeaQ/YmgE (transglycosylase-associated protein family)